MTILELQQQALKKFVSEEFITEKEKELLNITSFNRDQVLVRFAHFDLAQLGFNASDKEKDLKPISYGIVLAAGADAKIGDIYLSKGMLVKLPDRFSRLYSNTEYEVFTKSNTNAKKVGRVPERFLTDFFSTFHNSICILSPKGEIKDSDYFTLRLNVSELESVITDKENFKILLD